MSSNKILVTDTHPVALTNDMINNHCSVLNLSGNEGRESKLQLLGEGNIDYRITRKLKTSVDLANDSYIVAKFQKVPKKKVLSDIKNIPKYTNKNHSETGYINTISQNYEETKLIMTENHFTNSKSRDGEGYNSIEKIEKGINPFSVPGIEKIEISKHSKDEESIKNNNLNEEGSSSVILISEISNSKIQDTSTVKKIIEKELNNQEHVLSLGITNVNNNLSDPIKHSNSPKFEQKNNSNNISSRNMSLIVSPKQQNVAHLENIKNGISQMANDNNKSFQISDYGNLTISFSNRSSTEQNKKTIPDITATEMLRRYNTNTDLNPKKR